MRQQDHQRGCENTFNLKFREHYSQWKVKGNADDHHMAKFRKQEMEASLVAQWLKIRLLMQGTRVRSLGREDPTCRGATKPVRHNYWACALELASHNCWAHVPRAQALQQEKPPQRRVAPTCRN